MSRSSAAERSCGPRSTCCDQRRRPHGAFGAARPPLIRAVHVVTAPPARLGLRPRTTRRHDDTTKSSVSSLEDCAPLAARAVDISRRSQRTTKQTDCGSTQAKSYVVVVVSSCRPGREAPSAERNRGRHRSVTAAAGRRDSLDDETGFVQYFPRIIAGRTSSMTLKPTVVNAPLVLAITFMGWAPPARSARRVQPTSRSRPRCSTTAPAKRPPSPTSTATAGSTSCPARTGMRRRPGRSTSFASWVSPATTSTTSATCRWTSTATATRISFASPGSRRRSRGGRIREGPGRPWVEADINSGFNVEFAILADMDNDGKAHEIVAQENGTAAGPGTRSKHGAWVEARRQRSQLRPRHRRRRRERRRTQRHPDAARLARSARRSRAPATGPSTRPGNP